MKQKERKGQFDEVTCLSGEIECMNARDLCELNKPFPMESLSERHRKHRGIMQQ